MARSRKRKPLPTTPVAAHIDSLSHDGRGVAHIDGKAVFIHGALPGEDVEFIYTRKSRNFDEGDVSEINNPSADRVDPGCEHFGLCGGCSLQHLSSEAQILAKQQTLLDAFERIGKVKPEEVLAPLSTGNPWGYRKKARLGVKYVVKKGKVLVGFRERSSRYLADMARCPVLDPMVGELLTPLGDLIGGLSVRDRIPQIEVAMGDDTCILVFRLLNPLTGSDKDQLLAFGVDHGVTIAVQEGGPETVRALQGELPELSYELPEYDLNIHFQPGDFTQVNTQLNRMMIAHALKLMAPESTDKILDLFCGLGNFTLPLARHAAEVVGVEGDSTLVQRAQANAHDNGIKNSRYYVANLYEPIGQASWLNERYDKALLDPPRSGALEVLEHLPKMGIQRIVYVSCYPGTLARDAGELVSQHGYRLKAAGVMDMFPHTAHVESIALFEKK